MFLSKLLPSEGLYCVAKLLKQGSFQHYFYKELPNAQNQLSALDAAGHTVYIAQATFSPEAIEAAKENNQSLPYGLPKEEWTKQRMKERSQDNAILLKNFFLDIDCGEKWPLKNQLEGLKELKKFIEETGLPFPAVVNSGNGLYAHWILEDAIRSDQWKSVAYILKQVVAKYSPKIGGDSTRTSDSASVLRAPGTTNRKPGKEEKYVSLLKDADPINFLDFTEKLKTAASKRNGTKINTSTLMAPKTSDVNAEFFSGLEYESVPSDANKVAEKCAQLRLMKETGGDITEPLWYACLGLLVFCENGEEIAHEWSTGHTGYDPAQTSDKIRQWRDSSTGPSVCANLGSINPSGCIGCPSNGKIKSPIVLGRPEPEAVETPDEQCQAPDGFRRSKDGLYAEEDGRWFKFYDCDLYPAQLAYDESLGYEVMTIRHNLPHEGDLECTIRSSLVNDPKALITLLSDNHIKVVGVKEKKFMVAFMESYAAKLQRQRRMSMLLCQMGWKEARNGKPMFVLGKKIFHADGSMEDASLARNVPKAAEGFRSEGSLDKWSEATRVLGKPGMEPFAFALLCSFGSPLMKYTGFDGAMVSLVGQSGAGKTLMLRFIQSVWGFHNDLMMLRDDTKNALVSRLGVYGNMPLTVDEVSNIDGMELSDLVYRVTQGRDKARLTKNAEERKLLNTWNTLAVTSSNASLVDKLSGAKHDATAEINRVFEYPVMEQDCFKDEATRNLYWTIHQNYGVAGPVYAKWLVENADKIKPGLEIVRAKIDLAAQVKGDERFWSAVASAAIYGGMVAQSLGLLKGINIVDVKNWVEDTIFNMRGDKLDLAGDSVSILGQFIDEHAANRLLVKGTGKKVTACTIIEPPRGQLVMRLELDFGKLYISRTVLRAWITRKFGSYTQIKNDLTMDKALINASKRKVLGAGTFYGGAQQDCWEIDITCPKLRITPVQDLVQVAEALAKIPRLPGDDI